MLEPHSRQLLLDALRPPDDYALDFAVGTTYSLDLLALLTAPLGFTRFELQHSEGTDIADADAHILLRTIREFADKITIFCQAGRIAVPKGQRPLLSALEDMVVEVKPAAEGRVFHPKVWALRFSRAGGPVLYRLLVLSRNLTFASSWDTLLVLDGELQNRTNAFKDNHPLGAFFAYLPDLAIRVVSPAVRSRVQQLQEEIRKVRFECPDGIEEVLFHPFGIPGVKAKTFVERKGRLAIVSPFLAPGALRDLTEAGKKKDVLISRLDSLQKLSAKELEAFGQIYSMDPDASVDPERAPEGETDPFGEGTGLHAKLYVGNDGWKASIWTGSANATNAAFGGNVELLVQLRGPKSRFGVDALLARSESSTSFRDLLVPFTPLEPPIPVDLTGDKLEEQLERLRTAIAAAPWVATITPSTDASFNARLTSDRWPTPLATQAKVDVYPITLNASRGVPINNDADVTFEAISTEAITSFFAFSLEVSEGSTKRSCGFVVNATLVGAPANRREVLLRSMLRDRRQLIRFLLLLLGETEDEVTTGGSLVVGLGSGGRPQADDSDALLEPLLRALDRDPSRLDHVARLLNDLGNDGDSIPDGLRELFAPIWEARQGLRS